MNESEIRAAILRILGQVAPEAVLDSVKSDVPLQDQFDIDSMDFLNFVSGIAQEIGVEVPERDYPKIMTLDACVAYLVARETQRGSA